MDFTKNKARLFKEAKEYYAEGDDERIKREYGPTGLWYSFDWRGKQNQRPTLAHIRETWGALNGSAKPAGKTKVSPAPVTKDEHGGMNL